MYGDSGHWFNAAFDAQAELFLEAGSGLTFAQSITEPAITRTHSEVSDGRFLTISAKCNGNVISVSRLKFLIIECSMACVTELARALIDRHIESGTSS